MHLRHGSFSPLYTRKMISRVITSMIVALRLQTLRFLKRENEKMILHFSCILYCSRLRSNLMLLWTIIVWENFALESRWSLSRGRFENVIWIFKRKRRWYEWFVGISFLFIKSCCAELISFILSDLFYLIESLFSFIWYPVPFLKVSEFMEAYSAKFSELMYSAYESLFGEIWALVSINSVNGVVEGREQFRRWIKFSVGNRGFRTSLKRRLVL